ncbi:ATP-binding protein [Bauldia litoralis]|uniref:RecF/RecN/SMC N terminal domain-containing protein n=1 Tax=Bauldia litoralis TaxID=665467 RepID=A0A1G6DQ62_9HYPH|nr:ATP-binding protein [Bauldia litoralis]SDB47256.1 RecF/RecN/SMC N terminal domain-containing protein [Bauldia litoralis]
MIKLEHAHIEEVRGIRKLDVDFGQATFAISGPNGSGKSGIIDAIEFGLTGEIGRLAGRGTKGLSVSEHGPHVDMVNFPDAAFVELKVFIPSLNKLATITRKVSASSKPTIVPDEPDVQALLGELAEHPEITLARRDILRFILVEPSKRSEEIQTILKLEEIGQTRSALNSAQNKLGNALKAASNQVIFSRSTLQRHLGIDNNAVAELLQSVNKRRAVLELAPVAELTADTRLDAGIADPDKGSAFNKTSALRDLAALDEASVSVSALVAGDSAAILSGIERLERDPALLATLQRRVLLDKGLALVDGPECPLCDHPWPTEEHLLGHLRAKLAKSDDAGALQQALLRHGAAIGSHVDGLLALLRQTHRLAKGENDNASLDAINGWGKDLGTLKTQLGTFDGVIGLKARLGEEWYTAPENVANNLAGLRRTIEAKPDQSAAVEAQTFLTTAQLRLEDYRTSMRAEAAAKLASATAKIAYEEYCSAMEDELNALYADIQADFSAFYRMVNEDDEATFTAELKPSESRVDLKVNFYDRGLYPPAAYHSEGHQDGMGVCLYLALMKRLFGNDFTIALLDDVVMSVDSDHRRQFCKLLKTQFPDTQFIITTHDRLWAQQMRSDRLVSAKTSLALYGWSVDTGPLVESNTDVWEDIDAALARGKADVAAAALRRHLEYVAWVLADDLGAKTVFHADGKYELGELIPAVLARSKELYGKAADAAQSWGNEASKAAVAERKAALAQASQASNVEQWTVNPAVHFNPWAKFGRNDFIPVVAAFKDLLGTLRCPDCGSWLYVTPRNSPEALRCRCASINFNLKSKPK